MLVLLKDVGSQILVLESLPEIFFFLNQQTTTTDRDSLLDK